MPLLRSPNGPEGFAPLLIAFSRSRGLDDSAFEHHNGFAITTRALAKCILSVVLDRVYDGRMKACSWLLATWSLLPLGAVGVGCKAKETPQSDSSAAVSVAASAPQAKFPPPKPATLPDGKKEAQVAVVWDDPKEWERSPRQNAMRRATYKVPAAKGDESGAEVAVFYFGPGQGGTVESNVERWAQQFGLSLDEVKLNNRKVNDLDHHTIEIAEGKYTPDMTGKSNQGFEKWAMVATIVDAPSGKYFFKLTGPAATVKLARGPFLEMLQSVKVQP
jgi:hypothetical protein